MEPFEESQSVVSSNKEPQMGSQTEPLSPISHNDHNDPHHSDPNQLDGEFQNKLDLKDEVETENKVSNFEVGSQHLSDEDASPEHGKSQKSDDVNDHVVDGWNDDNNNHGDDDGWNDGNHGGDATEHGKSQRSDDVNDHGDDGWNDGNHGDDGWNADGNHGDDGWNDGNHGGDGWNDDGWNGGDEGYGWNENVNENGNENVGGYVGEVEKNDERNSDRPHQQYPLRPEAEDCAFYLKTGACKFGFTCKFNHPVRRNNLVVKEKVGERDELEDGSSQTECKYYSRSGGCKYGKACKFNHSRGKVLAAPVSELNFLGLPIRLGEKECLYYMRNGSCKFGASCRFNHPDPTSGGGTSGGYGNGSTISLQGVSQSSVPSWSSTRTLKETSPYVPIVMSPTPGASPRSSDWNGYQAPVYFPERNMKPPPTYVVNNPAIETNAYMHHQKPMSIEEFPERPGEPECSYFLKTGDCKYKSNCKFHHPKHRTTRLPPCNLSDKGLPLRPDQIVCTHYSRYGICKFGPACKFDHPINLQSPTMPGFDQQTSYRSASNLEVAGIGGSSDARIQ